MKCLHQITFVLAVLAALAAAAPEETGDTTAASVDANHHKSPGRNPCKKPRADYDVCVVGCGGSGAYTAVQLMKLGYRVLVLEQQNRCGGHCEKVRLPGTQ
jgi:heterodisulfide reductase subunit A-like polyferredoxin